jgi:hypothetical protein
MSIANEIKRIKDAKAAIKQSIENKGVTVGEDVKLDKYADYIDNIEIGSGDSGGGSDSEYAWPNFFELRTKSMNCQYLFSDITVYEENTKNKNAIENLDTSRAFDLDFIFNNFNNPTSSYIAPEGAIKELDLTKWDVSNVLSFESVFSKCILDYLDISGWDFSKNLTTSYLSLFFDSRIKEVNMTNCNTSKVKSFYRFAYQAQNLVSIDMTGCDTSTGTSFSSMFAYCPNLTTIIGEIDASNVNGLYPGSSTGLFYKCTSLETVYLKNIYKNVTTMKNEAKWSLNLADTKVKDECLVYIINELPDLINDKGLTTTNKIVFTLPPTNTLTAEQVQVAIDKGWQVANTTY